MLLWLDAVIFRLHPPQADGSQKWQNQDAKPASRQAGAKFAGKRLTQDEFYNRILKLRYFW